MPYGEALYHIGIIVVAGDLVLAVFLGLALFLTGRNLKKKFDLEYGNQMKK